MAGWAEAGVGAPLSGSVGDVVPLPHATAQVLAAAGKRRVERMQQAQPVSNLCKSCRLRVCWPHT